MNNYKNKQIRDIAESYLSFEDSYDLLVDVGIESIQLCLDYDGVWKYLELKWMLDYFIDLEEYKKCTLIKEWIDECYIADKSTQDKLNKELLEYYDK